jgi:hypothetical protein
MVALNGLEVVDNGNPKPRKGIEDGAAFVCMVKKCGDWRYGGEIGGRLARSVCEKPLGCINGGRRHLRATSQVQGRMKYTLSRDREHGTQTH